jgi:hypothetical protein
MKNESRTENQKHTSKMQLDYIVQKTLIHLDIHEETDSRLIVTPLGSVTKDKLEMVERLSRLIAAAPDLLAFVQMLVDGAENDKPEPADLLTQAKALILRATGEK